MKGITIQFKNRPKPDGTLESFAIDDCVVANNGSPSTSRPEILIHLPKTDVHIVDGAFVEYGGHQYHITGTTAPQMDENTPTRWNRYAIAQRIRML